MQALKDEIEDLQIDLKKAAEEKEALTQEVEAQKKQVYFILNKTMFNSLHLCMKADEWKAARSEVVAKYNMMVTHTKNRTANLNEQVANLNKSKSELEAQIKDLTAENEKLKQEAAVATSSAADVSAAVSGDTAAELEALKSQLLVKTQERENAVKALAEEMERSAKAAAEYSAALVWLFSLEVD